MLRTAVFIVATITILASTAAAQVCHEVSPGVAQIDVTTNGTTIKMVGTIPQANSVSCGFTATFIIVIGRTVNDTITLNYVSPTIGVSLFLGGGSDSIVVDGNASNDRIVVASTGVDRDGDGGLDLYWDTTPIKLTLDGKAGDDVIDASASPVKTTINGGDGSDTLYGSGFNDAIDGGTGGDTIYGNGGNDSITGGLGDDSLVGGAGNDTFNATKIAAGGTDGHDLMFGGDGTDVASYTKRNTPVFAGFAGETGVAEDDIAEDVETIKGGSGADHFELGSFTAPPPPHNLYGGAGNDILVGGGGNDKLFGEAGNDILDGARGADILDGGDGNDLFLPSADTAVDALKCGTGRDWYTKGAEDTVNACEHAVDRNARVATGTWHTCAILADGRVKCWGDNSYGELGLGDTDNRGDASGEMGNTLPAVDLGGVAPNVFKAVAVAAGTSHTCALLDTGDVKCWGMGSVLGQGDTMPRGYVPGQMGNALAPINLGTSRRAVAITAGYWSTCALLDTGDVKCWGFGDSGALGHGDTATLGDGPGEMGDALLRIDLGLGRTAIAIASVGYHTCAILDDGHVKCWGLGAGGQLGNGSTGNVGDQPGEMGDALATVDLGTNRIAIALASGSSANHSCALLDDGTIKCWGSNEFGQLGLGDTIDRGSLPGQMGDALPAVSLGSGRTAIAVSAGNYETCAVLDDRSAKCWGRDGWGVLGQGYGMDRGGWPGSMGDALAPIALGTGRTATAVTVSGFYYVCASLDNHQLKCWGRNLMGSLGLGDTVVRGDTPESMGDGLPYVDLGTTIAFAPPSDGPADPADPGDSASADELDDGSAIDDPIADDDTAGDDVAGDDDGTIDDDTAAGCSAGGGAGSPWLVALGLALAISCRRRKH